MSRSASAPVAFHEANLVYLREQARRLRLRLQLCILRQGVPGGEAADAEARGIAGAEATVAENLQRLEESFRAAGTPPPIDVLAERFRLTAFERDVLLLLLAPELDSGFERLFAFLHDDGSRRYATPDLAIAACAPEQWLSARDGFLPESPLRRYWLIRLDTDPRGGTAVASRAIWLDERVTAYLLGVNRLDATVRSLLTPVATSLDDSADALDARAAAVRRWVEQGADADVQNGGKGVAKAGTMTGAKTSAKIVNLIGPVDTGKRSLAGVFAAALGLGLAEISVPRIEAAGTYAPDLLRLIERDALLLEFALFVDVTADATPGNAMLWDELGRLNVVAFVGTRQPLAAAGARVLGERVEKPDPQRQRGLWRQALNGVAPEMGRRIEDIVEQFDFGPDSIAAAAGRAQQRIELASPPSSQSPASPGSLGDELWRACREQAREGIQELAQLIRPCFDWDDIVLPVNVMRQLREVANQVEHRAHVYQTWGFGAKLSRGSGISAMFAGPSGTGKTMAAEVLANHLRLDLYRVDLASTVSKYVGETEKNLAKIFDAAEKSGAILFFDEADAVFAKRVDVKEGHDRYANIETNYLLQRMEDYRGLAILATNKKSNIDEAFLRRLRFLIDFPAPDLSMRRNIWERSFPPKADVGALDYGFLARLNISGGNIRTISLNAAFLAAGERRGISMDDVMLATRREYAKIDKLVQESEFGPYYPRVKD